MLPNIGAGTDKARFLMKVRHFLTQHENHITIQKLRRNEQLTPRTSQSWNGCLSRNP